MINKIKENKKNILLVSVIAIAVMVISVTVMSKDDEEGVITNHTFWNDGEKYKFAAVEGYFHEDDPVNESHKIIYDKFNELKEGLDLDGVSVYSGSVGEPTERYADESGEVITLEKRNELIEEGLIDALSLDTFFVVNETDFKEMDMNQLVEVSKKLVFDKGFKRHSFSVLVITDELNEKITLNEKASILDFTTQATAIQKENEDEGMITDTVLNWDLLPEEIGVGGLDDIHESIKDDPFELIEDVDEEL